MLTFKNSKKSIPICRIEGGKYNNKILHIYDKTRKCCALHNSAICKKKMCCEDCDDIDDEDILINDVDPLEIINEQYIRNKKSRMSLLELEKIRKALKNKSGESLDYDLKDIYNSSKSDINNKLKNEFKLEEGKMVPLPELDEKVADMVYVSAPTGAGKSTWCGSYVKEIKRVFPKKNFIVFSSFDKDPAFDHLKPMYIKIDDEMIDNPIQKEELRDSVVLFDDIDTITAHGKNPRRWAEACQRLRNDLLQCGRKEGIKVISTSHQLMNYKHTRDLLNSCSKVTFFPQATSHYHLNRFLRDYVGLDKYGIAKILNLPSRWVMINKHYPMYCVYESGCFLINKDMNEMMKMEKENNYYYKTKEK